MKRIHPRAWGFCTSFIFHRHPSPLVNSCKYLENSGSSSSIIFFNARQFSCSSIRLSSAIEIKESTPGGQTLDPKEVEAAIKAAERTTIKFNVDKTIAEAQNVEELLALSSGPNIRLKEYCQIVYNLGQIVRNSPKEVDKVLKDVRFQNICSLLEVAHYSHSPHLLPQALDGLAGIGLSSDNRTRKYLENELKWVVRRCPIRVVSQSIAVLAGMRESSVANPTKTKLDSSHPLIVAIDSLHLRWVEVTTGGEFISTFQVSSFLNKDTRSKLEDRAVTFVQDFSPMEMVKIIIALGNQKRRPTPLLRSLAFYLSKSSYAFGPRDFIELLYAMSELSFADPGLMNKICGELAPCISMITSPALISSLVTSLGKMRYKDKDLVEAIEEWIAINTNSMRPFDHAAWLLTSSVLNVQSAHIDSFCTKAKKVLGENRSKNPVSWVNIVHALAILNHADESMLSEVLAPAFVSETAKLGDKVATARIKLLNLNALSKAQQNYKGPRLADEIVKAWTSKIVSSDDNLSKTVLETLRNFLPPPKYLLESQQHSSGVFVDAICKLNGKLDPVEVDSVSTAKNPVMSVAIVTQGYLMNTLGIREPTGSSALLVRLLQKEGFRVLTVPYTEFNPQDKLLQRVQNLEQRLRNIPTGAVSS